MLRFSIHVGICIGFSMFDTMQTKIKSRYSNINFQTRRARYFHTCIYAKSLSENLFKMYIKYKGKAKQVLYKYQNALCEVSL